MRKILKFIKIEAVKSKYFGPVLLDWVRHETKKKLFFLGRMGMFSRLMLIII